MLGFLIVLAAQPNQGGLPVGVYLLGSVLTVAVSGGVSYVTVRSSNKTTLQTTDRAALADVESARAVAETEAYARARNMLSSTIDELEEQLASERTQRKTEVDALNRQLAQERTERISEGNGYRQQIAELTDRMQAQAALIRRLRPNDVDD